MLALISTLRRCSVAEYTYIFFQDASFPSYCINSHVPSATLSLAAVTCRAISDLLDRSQGSIIGHWHPGTWSWPGQSSWTAIQLSLVEQMIAATLSHNTTQLPSSKDLIFTEWSHTRPRLKPRDPRRHLPPFSDEPSPTLHPFVKGVLSAGSRHLQCAAFQVITGHSFQADYSLKFRAEAQDNLECPRCGEHCNTSHIIEDCDSLWVARRDILRSCATNDLFLSYQGARTLVQFLHETQTLLRPIPPPERPFQPDPPWPSTAGALAAA